MKMILPAAMSCLLMLSCGSRNRTEKGNAKTALQAYPATSVSAQDVTLQSVYPVTIKGKEDIEIRPRIDGFIDDIYVDEGSVVTAGQALFKINSPQAEQALEIAKAGVTAAEAQLSTALLNFKRMLPLAEKNIISSVQLESYQYAYNAAQAAKAQADATLKNAEATLGWTKVTSPVDGMTGAIPYRRGSLVNSQNVLTTVANTSRIFAHFSLNEKALTEFLNNLEGETQAEKIKNAPDITLALANGSAYPEKGRIETITGVLNITTGSANFRVEFPNPQGLLKSGMSGKITIPRTLEKALLIPQKATFAQQDKVLVYMIQGDSVIQKVISVLATPDGKHYVVTEGLNQGDRIVTDGIATLSHGKKITAQE
ncbi:MAG: efflux RND transporter periplasmic adaptor subunit [Tannerellaceae bacterium]|nr:efflux RND transporter periplasmic adaptor subunit [Tannerellaceae bacterium]